MTQDTPARVMISGSRQMTDADVIAELIAAARILVEWPHRQIVLVHGAARGVDTLAALAATKAGIPTEAHPARWTTHTAACPASHAGAPTCRMAGHRRNQEMIETGIDLMVAAPIHLQDDTSGSRGTWGAVAAAKRAGVPTLVLWDGALHSCDDAAEALLCRQAQRVSAQMPVPGQLKLDVATMPF